MVPDKFKWDITEIYNSIENWERSKNLVHDKIEELKPQLSIWTNSAKNMYFFLKSISKIEKELLKLNSYAALNSDINIDESVYISMKGDIRNLYVKLNESISSIESDILKTGKKKIDSFISSISGLKDYDIFFDSILRMKKHILSGKISRISALTGLFSDTPQKTSSILNNLEIPKPKITLSDGKKIELDWTSYEKFRGISNRKDRKNIMTKFWKNHSGFRNTHATLLDGEVKSNYFNANIRKYRTALEASLFPNNIDKKVYISLIESVRNNLKPLHRYLDIKKKLLGVRSLEYHDLYTSSAKKFAEKTYSYEEAVTMIIEALKPLGNDYLKVLKTGFSERWIDVFPCRSKISGAYSNGMISGIHPFILMNFNGKFSSVSTLAHEMGHALHSWFSNKNQPFPKADYPIFLAEIASTFNENLLIHHMVKKEKSELMRIFILDNYLEGFRTTLYRQTLFAEFELLIHTYIENGRTLTADWLDQKYLDLTKEYYGHNDGILKVNNYIANEWSAIPHFYYNFYVYQYSTGIISSGILANNVINGGRTEREKYLRFLKAGNSDYPLNILKKTGVDLTDQSSFIITFENINNLVSELEKSITSAYPNFPRT